ncbi:hypothetical protein [Balneola vulgaris]|uniref:hypothetical protein n=1 Tax=Balneola vulgaris TaxID=287535 RepID=UPI0003633A57|nr:hypothetical protein [Balneola vulgaris]
MKSLKSLFALIAFVSLSIACNSVTDANFDEASEPTLEQNTSIASGNDSQPIITKPKM